MIQNVNRSCLSQAGASGDSLKPNTIAFFSALLFGICAILACSLPTDPNVSPVGANSSLIKPPNGAGAESALRITEIGSAYYGDSSTWVEVYNASSQPVHLSSYQFRSTSRRNEDSTLGYTITYSLPPFVVAPGAYFLLRARPYSDYVTAGNTAFLLATSGSFTYTPRFSSAGNGFVEILFQGKTVDFVRFGSNSIQPLTGTFQGLAPAVMASNTNGYGFCIRRDGLLQDTDQGNDWVYASTATPGGPNDVTDGTDADGDGIPDSCELPGSTFAGMPLYNWGARQGVRDIFIHLDYMESADVGIIPNRTALTRVRDAFRAKGIEIHFDVGNLYHGASGISPDDFDLSDTPHVVPFAAGITLGAGTGLANLYTYKNAYMPLSRREIFHYLIFANSQQANGAPGSSGRAEIRGNDIMVTLGQWFTGNYNTANYIVNWQSSTLMHELGHNLGLLHGGFENNNYKPNYISVMNYLYQLNGLPDVGGGTEGDRFYFENGGVKGITFYTALSGGPHQSPSLFRMDYSDGTGSGLNELLVSESAGLGRAASLSVDFNADGSIANGYARNLNSNYSTTAGETLNDFNDWGNLYLTFQRTYDGDTSGKPAGYPGFFFYQGLESDEQPLSPVCPSLRRF